MTNRTHALQTQFFEKIKDVTDPKISYIDELSDVLGVSRDSVYRRIRNETSLSLEEIIILSEYFKVSFDLNQNQDKGTVTFGYKSMATQEDFKGYLKNIISDLSQIIQSDKKLVTYAASDVPVFHNFMFKDLTAFKVFYWMKGVVDDPILQGKQFDEDLIDPEVFELTKTLYKAYSLTPSREIWTPETVNSQIEQIRYYWESGLFKSKEDAVNVLEQAQESFNTIKEQVSRGTKILEGKDAGVNNFEFYYSEIEIGNNTIMVDRGESKMLYLSFNSFNKMLTTNKKFCEETQNWLDNLIKKSVLISGVSEKLRYQFFNSINKKLAGVREQIIS